MIIFPPSFFLPRRLSLSSLDGRFQRNDRLDDDGSGQRRSRENEEEEGREGEGTGSFTRRGDRGLCLIILTEVLPSRSLRGNKNGETGESFARPNVVLVVVVERSCYFAGSLCRLQESPRVSTSFPFPSPPRIDLGESERITEFPQLREPIDKESSQEKGPAESRGNTFSTFSPPPPLILFSALVQPSIYVLYRHRGNMIAMSKTRKRIQRRRREEGGGDGIIDETRDR